MHQIPYGEQILHQPINRSEIPIRLFQSDFMEFFTHMQHHYKTPQMRFGVSSPLWDYVFHTMPKEE